MSELEKNTEIAKLSEFTLDLKLVKEHVPVMIKSTNAAMLAMSQITEITTDEMDAKVNNLLVKVKNTLEMVKGKRKVLTDNYDAFKKTLMLIEGELDNKKGAKNDVSRLKILREDYAQVKLDKHREEEKELEKQKLITNKLIDFKTALIKNIEIGAIDVLSKAEAALGDWSKKVNLENYDGMLENLNYTPVLKLEIYSNWFVVNLDMAGVDGEKVTEVLAEVKAERSYGKLNKAYQVEALKKIEGWRAKMPEIKKRLEDIAKADGKKKKELEAQLKAKQKIEDEQAAEESAKKKEEKAQEIAVDASDDKLTADFVEQGGKQKIEGDKVNAKFTARFTQDNWVRPFSEVVYHVASHPDFKGIYAKERTGEIKTDDKGRDQYIDHIDWFLKFFAQHCNANIEGLKLYADAKVQSRKKK